MINRIFFEQIFMHSDSVNTKLGSRVREIYSDREIQIVTKEPILTSGPLTGEDFERSKRLLYITPFEGKFFKRCPGATQKKILNCCNYYVLNLGSQCNMDCSYCYLQSYLNSPLLKLYSNIDSALDELDEMAILHSELPYRVGTGEIMDSLSMDPLTLFSHDLIPFFKKYPKWTLEFKTKSDKVDHFLNLGPAKNVVVSWSVNADFISQTEEHGTASLHERLYAAQKCRDAGFGVAFHIDPLIWHTNWKNNYQDLVNRITQIFSPHDVQVISIGTLRFQPEQKMMMKSRFPTDSWVNRAEMFPSEGSKLRYDSQIRQEMMNWVRSLFYKNSTEWKLFFCMETPETWIESFQNTPMNVSGLKDFFRPLPKIETQKQPGIL